MGGTDTSCHPLGHCGEAPEQEPQEAEMNPLTQLAASAQLHRALASPGKQQPLLLPGPCTVLHRGAMRPPSKQKDFSEMR